MLAMAPVAPERVLTSGHDTTNAIGMGHQGPTATASTWRSSAAAGALREGGRRRRGRRHVANCTNVPVESLEQDYPFMRVEEYAMRRGSAGAGGHRGGMGARRVYRILENNVTFNCYSDRFRIAPWGLFGGQPGQPSRFIIERDGETIVLGSKVNVELRKGDRLIIEIAGGGGYGDPRERDRAAVLRDLDNGFISSAEAHDVVRTRLTNDDQNRKEWLTGFGRPLACRRRCLECARRDRRVRRDRRAGTGSHSW